MNFKKKIIRNEEVKFQPKTEEKYSLITKALLEKKQNFIYSNLKANVHSISSLRKCIILQR